MSEKAISDFTNCNIPALKRRLQFILRNPADVEDVIQDAYLKILESADDGPAIDNPGGFLHRVTRNRAIDELRCRQRQTRICISMDESEEIRAQVESLASHDLPIDELLEQEEIMRCVQTAVSQLPVKCQQAFLLKCVEGHDYREISAQVGLSVSMIEKYVLRARHHVVAYVAPRHALLN